MKELIDGFNQVAVASVADAVDKVCGKRGYMATCIKPRINDKRICGPAATVLEAATDEFVPPQHALDLIDEAPAGSVIVISIEGGEPDVAVWGGLMTAGAVANGHAGAVLDGGVRDLTEIRRDYGFPVYARDVSPGTTLGRYRTVASQVPVRVGDIMVHPGDIVVGDVDGVVVVPRAQAEEVLKMAKEIDERELEQAKLIIAEKSLRKGLAKYGRI
ncbi:RraA family protein [Hydrogenophaga intermedia]|jgi:4-hydroxy-4-methyl-2-oxoglutarate aldolase|uniref:Putative 4-hydroxy-4-methyl-2-oxoglutarate aldolase n=1 Tax=Hydrogenophaga intermedia TaxID=65786 RepID=A0A1L1PI18_HYDIT|nr:RraA family protein [Hydrogenophaga intermedia]TMU72319.1 RraA family protein [Hydrogenophaga intermedia]CDN89050.1 Dimethylmenaquinone methyltransferase [Hydrogenophaga intermedia]